MQWVKIMGTKTYLFQMTIPSVQKFISSSRKSSDLWAGSFMVSYLMEELLKFVEENYKVEFIYPVIDDDKEERELIANIPNIAIFAVNNIDDNKAKEVKEKLKEKFEKLLNSIIRNEKVFEKFFKEKVEKEHIKKAFNIKNDEKAEELLEKRKEIVEKHKNEYLKLAEYQAKETLKLFIEHLEFEEDEYKITSEDLANLISYRKKSQLPDREYIESYKLIELIEPANWDKWNNWEDFYENNLKHEIINNKDKKENIENLEYLQGVYRCSSCGEHTIIGATLKDWKGDITWKPLWETNPKLFNMGERLCGICLAKRYFRDYIQGKYEIKGEDLGFPSTSEIGATLFKKKILKTLKQKPDLDDLLIKFYENLEKIPNFNLRKVSGNLVPKLENAINEIFPIDKNLKEDKQCKTYKFFQIDGEWFLEDTWQNPNDYETVGADSKKANQMLRILKEIQNNLKDRGIEKHYKPSEYYAVIMLDGDSIGEKLDKIKEIDKHRKFSKTLSKLSKEFENIVKENYGALIYSGGDDVLALLPVENALDCAYKIQNEFKAKLVKEFSDIDKESPFSMSGAIIYAHHKLPLSYVLEEARKCESNAKDEGKNRVCLKYIKRSLSSAEVVLKWDKSKHIYNLKKDLNIPISIIYDLQKINNTSGINNLKEGIKLREFLLKSLLKNKVKKEEIDRYMDLFYEIDDFYDFLNLSNTLKVFMFIE